MESKNEILKKSERCTQARPFNGRLWVDDYTDIWTGSCDKLLKKVAEINLKEPVVHLA